MNKLLLAIFLTLFVGSVNTIYGQDIIFRTDKSEIKSKVIEIGDKVIKYQLFDHEEGPIYSIIKDEVFMILYQNGKRETFGEERKREAVGEAKRTKKVEIMPPPNTKVKEKDSSIVDFDAQVKYAFLRLTTDVNAINVAPNLVFGGEWSISKRKGLENYIRIGWSAFYVFGDGFNSSGMLLNVTPHIPLNYILGNIEKRNLGLFPFLRIGAGGGATSVTLTGFEHTTWAFSHQVELGVDYVIGRKFGLTASSDKFKTFSAGILFNFY